MIERKVMSDQFNCDRTWHELSTNTTMFRVPTIIYDNCLRKFTNTDLKITTNEESEQSKVRCHRKITTALPDDLKPNGVYQLYENLYTMGIHLYG